MIDEFGHKQEIIQKIKEFKKEFPEGYEKKFRTKYLENLISGYSLEIEQLYQDYETSLENNEEYVNRAVLSEAIRMREKQKTKCESELKARFSGNRKRQEDKIACAKERKFSEFIELKRGRALCPIHGDNHNPAFSVKNERGHCFSCGWSGDIIDFIMKLKDFSFMETINFLT
jgi:hypothetical protein